jgi:lactate dehydrogenase-like 2-hydroxyacid dehydrogenase
MDMTSTLPRVLALSEWMSQLGDVWKGHFDVVGPGKNADTLAWLEENGRGITAMWAVGHDPLGAEMLDRLPDLRRVVVMSAGMDGMDVEEMARRRLVVSTTSEINGDEVADHSLAMMLALRRGIIENHRWVRENRWVDEGRAPMTRSMANTNVGIAGLGWIGEAIARRVVPFRSEIAWWGPRDKPGVAWPRYDSLLELARWCDVLIVAVRAHDDTRGLITREVIEAVGPEGILINISRGFVVDEDAVIAALKDGRLGQAGLDVFEPEPTTAARWEGVPNVLLQPHVAGATVDSIQRVIRHSVDQLRSFLAN